MERDTLLKLLWALTHPTDDILARRMLAKEVWTILQRIQMPTLPNISPPYEKNIRQTIQPLLQRLKGIDVKMTQDFDQRGLSRQARNKPAT